MKIDSTNPVTGTKVSETRNRSASKAAPEPQPGNVADVHLSGASAGLQSSGDASTFDAARVAEIKQAITDGRFKINAGAIADRLLASARELVDAQRQA